MTGKYFRAYSKHRENYYVYFTGNLEEWKLSHTACTFSLLIKTRDLFIFHMHKNELERTLRYSKDVLFFKYFFLKIHFFTCVNVTSKLYKICLGREMEGREVTILFFYQENLLHPIWNKRFSLRLNIAHLLGKYIQSSHWLQWETGQ